jgi:hypothetical protein
MIHGKMFFIQMQNTCGCSDAQFHAEQTIFESKVSKFHKNYNSEKVVDLKSTNKSFLYFSFGYETFNKKKHSKNLIYDTGNFLTQVGGNLGLFLGFSCFSVILAIIECLNKWKRGCQILK